ncbi:hypothetical protein BOX15_Mlig023323g2 [Macrostomum lignano]|uniref:Uncharacterized protein n=1 Tax=Macrostomum lignano TaxID=282301 RepID=A0A267H3A0_9PLAT|nr:hypothetical protein BOX15_Mlig023323g2 [Macrostomum lignano]
MLRLIPVVLLLAFCKLLANPQDCRPTYFKNRTNRPENCLRPCFDRVHYARLSIPAICSHCCRLWANNDCLLRQRPCAGAVTSSATSTTTATTTSPSSSSPAPSRDCHCPTVSSSGPPGQVDNKNCTDVASGTTKAGYFYSAMLCFGTFIGICYFLWDVFSKSGPLSRLIMLLKRQFKNKKEPVQSVQETEAAQAKDDGDAQADSALIDNITAAGADNTESKNDIKTRSPSSNANFMPVAAPVESHIDDDEVSALDITGGNQRAAPQRTRTTSTSSSQVLGGEFETA